MISLPHEQIANTPGLSVGVDRVGCKPRAQSLGSKVRQAIMKLAFL
jgi:hypothetical protein